MKSPRRGVTLMEALVSCGLLCIMLGVVGQVFADFSQATRPQDQRLEFLRTLKDASNAVVAETLQAVEVSKAESGMLSLLRVAPGATENDQATPTKLLSVTYQLTDGVLLRKAGSASAPVARDVAVFRAALSTETALFGSDPSSAAMDKIPVVTVTIGVRDASGTMVETTQTVTPALVRLPGSGT